MSCAIHQEGVHWFEIPVENMERAKTFYEAVFGLPLWLEKKGPVQMALWPKPANPTGAGGALIKVESLKPSLHGTLIYFSTADIQSVLDKVHANGGKTIKTPMTIGEHGVIAHFEDTEGNRLGLHQAARAE